MCRDQDHPEQEEISSSGFGRGADTGESGGMGKLEATSLTMDASYVLVGPRGQTQSHQDH